MTLVEELNADISAKAARFTALTEQREALKESESLFATLYGGGTLDVQGLLKKFAPLAAKFGLPPALIMGAADSGAFSGVFNAFGKVFSLFGLG